MEIGIRRPSHLFLKDFHKVLGKTLARTARVFPQLPPRRRPLDIFTGEEKEEKNQTHDFGVDKKHYIEGAVYDCL
jgi:hypothetical protein